MDIVGGFNTSERYESIGMTIPSICKNEKCSKPPTRWEMGSQPYVTSIIVYTWVFTIIP